MKILVLTHLDATNNSMVGIIRELKKRGHYIEGYGKFVDYHNIVMFSDVIPIYPLDDLTDDHILEFDIIFSALDVIDRVRHIKKYIFCYSLIFTGNLISDCGDFMFTQCEERRLPFKEECSTMAIGNPKNYTNHRDKSKKNRFLFIDSGHFPFGKQGRLVLAKLLIDICKEYKDYEIEIRPRFLRGEKNVTHQNNYHLYDVIDEVSGGNVPTNMKCIEEHRDLYEQINNADVVLCTMTSAYVDVILSGKPLIIICGLPNMDTFELQNDYDWKKMKETMEGSGCLVNYSEVLDYLPTGIIPEAGYIETIVKYPSKSQVYAANVIEYVFDKYLSKDLIPCIKEYHYEAFKEELENEGASWDEIIKKRYKNKLRYLSRGLNLYEKYGAKECYMHYVDELEKYNLLGKDTYKALLQVSRYCRNELIISAAGTNNIDSMEQSYFLRALWENKHYDEFLRLDEKEIMCFSQYYYIKARILFFKEKYNECIEELEKYLCDIEKKDFPQYSFDTNDRVVSAHFHIASCFYKLGDIKRALKEFYVCEEMTDNKHIKAKEFIDMINHAEKMIL